MNDETPKPRVKRLCRACGVTQEDVRDHSVVISPAGMAHFGREFGMTKCGRDATGDEWWWPL